MAAATAAGAAVASPPLIPGENDNPRKLGASHKEMDDYRGAALALTAFSQG